MKNIITPAIVCGFGAAVLSIVPGVKDFACCLTIPVAAIIASILFFKSQNFNKTIPESRSVIIGLLTGIFAALFTTGLDTLIIYITKTSDFAERLPELEKMFKGFPDSSAIDEAMTILEDISYNLTHNGFSIIYSIYFLVVNLIINSIFGTIGGIIGMQIIKKRYRGHSPE